MKKRVLQAVAAVLAVAGTTIGEAAAQDVEVKSSGSSPVRVGPAEGQPGTTSIRVAGFEVQYNDDSHGAEIYALDGRVNWPHRGRERYSGRIGLLEAGANFMRTYADSYAAYPDGEKGFMALNYNSQSLTFNLGTYSTSFVRGNWLGVTMALGLMYNQWDLDAPVALAKVDRMLRPVVGSEGSFRVSRLRSWGLHMPIMLEIHPTRKFFLSAGGYMDMMISTSAKWKKPKHKFSDPYINPLQMGVMASIGFRSFYFWGKYSFSEMFQQDKGPRMNPYSIGLGTNF